MKRRAFIALLGGAAAAWPLAARAQQTGKLSTIGWIEQGETPEPAMTAFNRGLAEAGYVVGRNVNLERRNVGNNRDLLRMLVAEFVRQQVAVIVANTGTTAQA